MGTKVTVEQQEVNDIFKKGAIVKSLRDTIVLCTGKIHNGSFQGVIIKSDLIRDFGQISDTLEMGAFSPFHGKITLETQEG